MIIIMITIVIMLAIMLVRNIYPSRRAGGEDAGEESDLHVEPRADGQHTEAGPPQSAAPNFPTKNLLRLLDSSFPINSLWA